MIKPAAAIALFFVLGGGLALWNVLNPPRAERGDEATASQGAPLVEVALPAALSAEAELGKRAFEANCASCHGTDAAGRSGIAPPLVHRIYEPNHHADMAFVLAAKNGVPAHHWPFGNMPPVEGLTDADVKNIIRYVRALQKENGIF